ncbi:glutamate racemase [Psychrobacter sanguinis]|uniref:glutamate racemase n=1 Tax=Psychrobacter sanguinis TaxID=861445 RepID=UPI00191A9FDC|nr:glutamate racemase [Psychrobacter sanguinis]MCC3346002.1 glutamate racemase [Psychrobacter sanguinis]
MATQTAITSSSSVLLPYSAPIGIFDSGVGGLSVYLHLKQQLPNEHYLYYADTLNVPYGPRSSAEIKALTLIAVDWLVAAGCKLIVIACNSASAHALPHARQKHPHIPIVGLVPALKPAVLNSSSKNVAVLATKATLDGELLNTVISDYALPADVNVVKWFDPNLVPWVEAGMPLDSETPERLKRQLKSFAEQRVDHLVLGCTHYPFFREFVLAEVENENLGIKVVDSGAAIAARVKALLQQFQSLALNGSLSSELSNSESLSTELLTTKSLNPGPLSTESLNARLTTIELIDTEFQIPSVSELYIGHTTQGTNDFSQVKNIKSKLSFFVSDPKADLAQVTRLVQRLIYRESA